MRTSLFAQKHNISQSTVSFYLKAGLLMPKTVGGRYDFGPEDDEDMAQIQALKDWQFSLEDISAILSERRLARDSVKPSPSGLLDMLTAHRRTLEGQQARLQSSIQALNKAISSMADGPVLQTTERVSGVDVRFLPYFFCPVCGAQLSARLDCISGGQFLTGELSCACGYVATVTNGLMENTTVPPAASVPEDPFFTDSSTAEMRNCFYRVYSCIAGMLETNSLEGKLLIETHIGNSSFLLQKARILPASALYLCCDPNRAVLEAEKRLLDQLDQPLTTLFLASNYHPFPIRRGSADYLISCFQSMFFTSTNNNFPFQRWVRYLNADSRILGAFIDLPANSETVRQFRLRYPDAPPEYYDYGAFKRSLAASGLFVEAEYVLDSLTASSYPWHRPGDTLRFYCYSVRERLR